MTTSKYCTTQQAANILGISVTYVQQLVEAGTLEAWKTRGGHRRIPVTAVQAYRCRMDGETAGVLAKPPVATYLASAHLASVVTLPEGSGDVARKLSLMIIEDSPMQRELYSRQLAAWQLPIVVTYCENGYQALIEITRRKPDILMVDIVMAGIDGYEVISTILAQPDLRDMHIAIVSSMTPETLAARGGVPVGVVYFQKPLSYDELRGYVRACCAACLREQQQQRQGGTPSSPPSSARKIA